MEAFTPAKSTIEAMRSIEFAAKYWANHAARTTGDARKMFLVVAKMHGSVLKSIKRRLSNLR